VNAVIGQFRAGQFTVGVVEGLDTLTIDPIGRLTGGWYDARMRPAVVTPNR
jgi:hypothetical protein